MKVNVYIPTLNAGAQWPEVVGQLRKQTYPIVQKVLVDSGSTDGTLAARYVQGFELVRINKQDFDHGGTRQLVIDRFPDADVYVFLTQDAILADENALGRLIEPFLHDAGLGMTYGRQLPHHGAKTLEAHARLFNYPTQSMVRSLADASKYGIKTVSCSNSFAAYRKTALQEVGGFPSGTILGEDVIVAGKLLLKGWKMAYISDSQVYHSHDYSLKEEFKRYFDIGVFHANDSWILQHFGKADGEGIRYVKSELRYVIRHNPLALPKAILSVFAKWLGYKIGLKHTALPNSWSRAFSMHKAYWHKHDPSMGKPS